jgi:hypothetical protein
LPTSSLQNQTVLGSESKLAFGLSIQKHEIKACIDKPHCLYPQKCDADFLADRRAALICRDYQT